MFLTYRVIFNQQVIELLMSLRVSILSHITSTLNLFNIIAHFYVTNRKTMYRDIEQFL